MQCHARIFHKLHQLKTNLRGESRRVLRSKLTRFNGCLTLMNSRIGYQCIHLSENCFVTVENGFALHETT